MKSRKAVSLVVFLFTTLMLSRPSYGQEGNIASTTRILHNDTTEIGVYIDLASYYKLNEVAGQENKADEYLEKALDIARKTNNEHYLLVLADKEGVRLRNLGLYQQSLFFHFFERDLLQTISDPILVMKCYNNIGVVFRRVDDYQLAIEYHLKALALADSLGNQRSKAIALNSIGNINYLLGDYNKALEFFEQSLLIEKNSNNPRGLAINLNNIGNVYLALNEHEKAREYYRRSLDLNLRTNDHKGTAICYNDLGNVYKSEKVYSEALNYYQKALELFLQINDIRYVVDSKLNLAIAYAANGEEGKAELFLLDALPQAVKLGSLSQLRDINQQLSDIYSLKHQSEKALLYYKASVVYKDSLLNEANRRNIAAIQTRYQSDQRVKEIELLKQENQIRELNQKRQYIVFYSVTAILLIGAIVAYMAYRTKRKREQNLKEKNAIIEKAQAELSRYANDLEAAKTKAEQMAEAKSEFLANMSHEIRTPLNSVLGFAEILAKNPAPKKTGKYIDAIRNSGKSLLTIINDILDMASIESGKISIVPVPVNLNNLIDEVLSSFSLMAEQKKLQLSKQAITVIPEWVVIDGQRLRQIIFNLVGNALKFTEKGSVVVEVGVSDVNAGPGERTTLKITISDTGKGIATENLNLIFESFRQFHDEDTIRQGGTGLGLTISKRLAHLMGGDIFVKSIEHEGSSFSLVLYDVEICNGIHLRETDRDEPGQDISFENSTLLIVDDINDNRLLMAEFTRYKGITTIEAADGKQALELARSKPVDLIFLDIRMPGIDGFEVNRQLKSEEATRTIPVVAVSASVLEADRLRFAEAGFSDFLTKPLQSQEIVNTLKKYLPVKKENG